MEFRKLLISVLIYNHLHLIRSSPLQNDISLHSYFENDTRHVLQSEENIHKTKSRVTRQAEFFNFIRTDYPLPGGSGKIFKQYDFIVIGGGSAGCTIANRLTENGKWSVLLLEAGATETILTDIPFIAPFLLNSGYTWGYKSDKRNNMYWGLEGSRTGLPRGKILGGTSVINFMVYTRGNRIDWDRIAAAGNPGWSYDEVLPYFIKSEKANLKYQHNSTYHSKFGLMSVENLNYKTPLIDAFLKSGKQLGYDTIDYNADERLGFSYLQATTLNGRRHSASKAFLYPFRNRTKLHIVTRARVTKININHITKNAESVDFVHNKIIYTIKAKKEVILSAGSLASPQLLMLSGIGPKYHLREVGIPLIQDLNVGDNVFDHIAYLGLVFRLNTTGVAITEDRLASIRPVTDWLSNGDGPLSIPSGIEGIAFVKTKASEEVLDHPDIELVLGAISVAAQRAKNNGLGIKVDVFEEAFGNLVKEETFSISPMLLHTRSKGQIRLKDKNPYHWPRVTYDYFKDERDLKTLVEGIKYAIKVATSGPFKKMGSYLHKKKLPTCATLDFGTDKYWECAVRSLGTSMQHHVGSCRMGPEWDHDAVVDHHLRVRGIKRLRVGDISVIPIALAAHTHAPAVMVGEKLADILKTDWS